MFFSCFLEFSAVKWNLSIHRMYATMRYRRHHTPFILRVFGRVFFLQRTRAREGVNNSSTKRIKRFSDIVLS